MAIHVNCPYCHQRLEELNQNCHHCGAGLPVGVLSALSAGLGGAPIPSATSHRVPPHFAQAVLATVTDPVSSPANRQSALRPWLAAALSCLCGLGQLYNGQIRKGIILLILGALAVFAWRFPVGKVLLPCLWLYAIVDAYLVARRPVYPLSR
jgi:TM2 domain-containing membrane protein YozV